MTSPRLNCVRIPFSSPYSSCWIFAASTDASQFELTETHLAKRIACFFLLLNLR